MVSPDDYIRAMFFIACRLRANTQQEMNNRCCCLQGSNHLIALPVLPISYGSVPCLLISNVKTFPLLELWTDPVLATRLFKVSISGMLQVGLAPWGLMPAQEQDRQVDKGQHSRQPHQDCGEETCLWDNENFKSCKGKKKRTNPSIAVSIHFQRYIMRLLVCT